MDMVKDTVCNHPSLFVGGLPPSLSKKGGTTMEESTAKNEKEHPESLDENLAILKVLEELNTETIPDIGWC